MRSIFVMSLALTLGLTACASTGSSSGSTRGSLTRITAEELEPLLNLDAFQAIQRLRAQWLRPRGGNYPQVLVDGNRQAGGVEALRSIRVADVGEIRFLSGRDATTRYGTGYDGGAIEIKTKR